MAQAVTRLSWTERRTLMNKILNVLSKEELTSFTLRALYSEYGYEKYRMSKFEEYDLYVQNKDFLISENVITFTDTDGKLMALKPDVTLSIIKNSKDSFSGVMKVYYNENVYRVSKGTRTYKEIMQAGLECLGEVTDEVLTEVLYLAAKSLDVISENNVLEISSLDVVTGVVNAFELSEEGKKKLFIYLGEKNVAGVKAVCAEEGLTEAQTAIVCQLVTVYGEPSKVLDKLDVFKINKSTTAAVESLKGILFELKKLGVSEKLCVDFSVVNDMKYYNGLAFKGFIEGIPTGILSGGQYDKLMRKMKKSSNAIGFAVYLDELNKLSARMEVTE
jgi:ATP phosphoribosyltransferase regulatory subunit